MRGVLMTSLLGLLAIVSTAKAGVDGVVTSRSMYSNIGTDGTGNPGPFSVANSATQLTSDAVSISNYQVSAVIGPTDITFGTNATTQGGFAQQRASTSVSVTFTNDGPTAVDPVLHSSIIPGGFGFYVGDLSGFPKDVGGDPIVSDANATPGSTATFDQLTSRYSSRFAEATFNFTVSSQGQLVTSYTGDAYLDCNTSGFLQTCNPTVGYSLGGQASTLANFAQVTPLASASAYAFQWDQTDFAVSLGTLLQPGQSRTFVYTTEVTASTDFGSGPTDTNLVAFSGFGDPIGKSGQTSPVLDPLSAVSADTPAGVVPITGLNFGRFAISLPTLNSNTGELDLPVAPGQLPNLPLTNRVALVPEPGTWSVMLLGVGGLGARLRALRSRRRGYGFNRSEPGAPEAKGGRLC